MYASALKRSATKVILLQAAGVLRLAPLLFKYLLNSCMSSVFYKNCFHKTKCARLVTGVNKFIKKKLKNKSRPGL